MLRLTQAMLDRLRLGDQDKRFKSAWLSLLRIGIAMVELGLVLFARRSK